MARSAFLLSAACALVLTGCDKAGPGGAGGGDRIAKLEKQVAQMEQRDRDLRTKMAARQSLGQWGWNNFLSQPEFWHCTYDSGWSDCASRCTKATTEGYNACIANNPEGPARQQCIQANAQRGSNCLQACPRPTPNSGVSSCFM